MELRATRNPRLLLWGDRACLYRAAKSCIAYRVQELLNALVLSSRPERRRRELWCLEKGRFRLLGTGAVCFGRIIVSDLQLSSLHAIPQRISG